MTATIRAITTDSATDTDTIPITGAILPATTTVCDLDTDTSPVTGTTFRFRH